jgi:GNAT superfamily N-acetyltransferase
MSSIRLATLEDAENVARLVSLAYRVEDFFKYGDRATPDEVRALIEHDGAFLVIDDEAGALVGAIYVSIEGDRGYFGRLAVHPQQTGQGLGGRLIAAAEARCRDAGCRQMDLCVVNLREDLPPFYRRFGYVESGTEPFNEPSKIPCHLVKMSKPL